MMLIRTAAPILAVALTGCVETTDDDDVPHDPIRVSETADWLAVDAGAGLFCALHDSGAIACWGELPAHDPDPPAGSFQQVSAGMHHACAIDEAGVTCWGNDYYDQVSDVVGSFTQLESHMDHNCALDADGTARCWGGDHGDLPGGPYTQVAAGGMDCTLDVDGFVTCWGYKAQHVPIDGGYAQVSTGDAHGCALAVDGTLSCWGDDYGPDGQVHTGQTGAPAGAYVAIDAGAYHSCALDDDGLVTCWGRNDQGECEPPGSSFAQVSASDALALGSTCGLRTDDHIECWGSVDLSGLQVP